MSLENRLKKLGRKALPLILVGTVGATSLAGCGKAKEILGIEEKNKAPETSIINIQVNHYEEDNFRFELRAIDEDGYVDHFEYKIEGIDKDWLYVDAVSSHDINRPNFGKGGVRGNIPAGEYKILAVAVDNKGKRDPTPTIENIKVPSREEIINDPDFRYNNLKRGVVTATEHFFAEDRINLLDFHPEKQSFVLETDVDKVVLMYYIPPPIPLDENSPLKEYELEYGKAIRTNPTTTALSLLMMNPLLIEASDEDKVRIAEAALNSPLLDDLAWNLQENAIKDSYQDRRGSHAYTTSNLELSCKVLGEIIKSARPKLADKEPPFVRIDRTDEVSLVNTQHIYYGAFTKGGDLTSSLTLLPRDGIFDYSFIPPGVRWADNTETRLHLPIGRFSTNITKGFELEEILEDPFGHSAQATYFNVGSAIRRIVRLAVDIPSEGDVSEFPNDELNSGLAEIVRAVNEGDALRVFGASANLLVDNPEEAFVWVFGDINDNVVYYLEHILPIIADLNIALRGVNAANSVPFFYDLVSAPAEITYYYSNETGNLKFIENQPPTFDPIEERNTRENQYLEFRVSAMDDFDSDLKYSVYVLPEGATFHNQVFSWTPNYDQDGTHFIRFEVTDWGGLKTSESVRINVENVNRNPNRPSITPSGEKIIREGQRLELTLSSTDPDGDSVKYHSRNMPNGANLSGRTFLWTPGYDQEGIYSVEFGAFDESGGRSSWTIVPIIVENASPPVIQPPEPEPIKPEPVPNPEPPVNPPENNTGPVVYPFISQVELEPVSGLVDIVNRNYEGGEFSGLTYDGSSLWAINDDNNTLVNFTTDFVTMNSFPLSSERFPIGLEDLEWHNGSLYGNDSWYIYKFDSSMNVVGKTKMDYVPLSALVSSRGELWGHIPTYFEINGRYGNDALLRFDNDLNVTEAYVVDSHMIGHDMEGGLITSNGNYFWTVTGSRLNKFSVSGGARVERSYEIPTDGSWFSPSSIEFYQGNEFFILEVEHDKHITNLLRIRVND